MSADQVAAAREIATKLRESGKQAWLVGGAVRDLALGLSPSDVDFTTDADPNELEAIFEDTISVGRAFGTVIVRAGPLNCEVTTFRSESSYSDSRHPDTVTFSATPEEDALRRDFTCNAIYLDPLDDRILDPTGGLVDLEARRLRCVGDPGERFAEDALRIMRLARFAAQPGLDPEPSTLAAARECADKLTAIAPERRLREVLSILARTNIARAIECLEASDALRWALFGGAAASAAACHERSVLFRDGRMSPEAGFAVLLGAWEEIPIPGGATPEWKKRLEAMRPSREISLQVEAIGRGVSELESLAESSELPARSRLIRALREPTFEESSNLVRARVSRGGVAAASLARLEERLQEVARTHELNPELFLVSSDLENAGVPRGRLWGELLAEAETRQLDGEFKAREDALAWLAQRAQDGGKTPRNNHEAG